MVLYNSDFVYYYDDLMGFFDNFDNDDDFFGVDFSKLKILIVDSLDVNDIKIPDDFHEYSLDQVRDFLSDSLYNDITENYDIYQIVCKVLDNASGIWTIDDQIDDNGEYVYMIRGMSKPNRE